MKHSIIFLILVPLILTLGANEESKFCFVLSDGWYIQTSEKVNTTGNIISSNGFNVKNWYATSVPSTVLAALVKNNVYKEIFVGENLKSIPVEQFKKSWWYRTEFVLPHKNEQTTVKIELDGINYRANIWLNGNQISDTNFVYGAFRQFEFDVTDYVKYDSKNILAIEVFPPTAGDYTIGFVDWNPQPPDKNMGLWREVKIKTSGDVSINFPFVKSKIDLPDLKYAELTISAEIKNNSNKKISGLLEGKIQSIKFSKFIELQPNENKLVTFLPGEFEQLKIKNPKIWWTHDLGEPELYDLALSFKIKNSFSDKKQIRFGIREVTDYFNEQGYRGYKLNGKKILIRGGGWVDDLLLNNSHNNLIAQIKYARHMNLNAIRLEGFWGNSEDLYNICDETGILIMVGWSCQWEWEFFAGKKHDEFGIIITDEDIKFVTKAWRDQIKWLRNHPAIFVWLYGSDKFPNPKLENEYQKILHEEDPTRVFLASAGSKTSSITGKTGVKMTGPYDYVPPHYWYVDSLNGGAFGFNTETGPGPQVPVISSIKKFIPPNHLWPIDSVWNFHCGGLEFKNLNRYTDAMNNRLGVAGNLDEFCTKAQFLNYEGMRAMFEAYLTNKFKTTGIIQWMFNAAWPKLWWQFFDYYLMPTGAFYGARKACEPIHILYNYGNKAVIAINNSTANQEGLRAEVKVLNFDLTEKFSLSEKFNLIVDEARKITLLNDIAGLSKTYFVDLKLYDKLNKLISYNFYSLSTKEEILDYEKSTWFVTPVKEYADLTDLNKLPQVKLDVQYKYGKKSGEDFVSVEIKNHSQNLAFQIELALIQNDNREAILPIFWDDNYFSLLPGEGKIINGFYSRTKDETKNPIVNVSGWNIK